MIFSLIIDILVIIILFIVFGYLHSLLASNKTKKLIIEKLGDKIAFYRLFYNILSFFLLLLIYHIMPKPDVTIYDLPYPFDFIVIFPQLAGLAGFILTLKYFCVKKFLGFEQIKRWRNGSYDVNELDENLTLRIEGPYRYTRHPLYFFSIMFLLFRPSMDLFYLVLLICIIIYFYAGSIYEERRLIEKFGDEYIKYKKQVPGIIPYKLFHPYNKI